MKTCICINVFINKIVLKISKKKFRVSRVNILAKNAEKTIKVLYPIQTQRIALFQNEIYILKKLDEKFRKKSQKSYVESGMISLIDSGYADWINEDNKKILPGYCYAVVYTYGNPLFPILRRCVQTRDHKMLFWYFSEMVRILRKSIDFLNKKLQFQCDQYYRLEVCLPF